MSGTQANLPAPRTPILDPVTGGVAREWFIYFQRLFARTGGSTGVLGAPGGSDGNVQFNDAGAFGGLTNQGLTAKVQAFTSVLSGAVPSSGGGTTKFLRADGGFAVPPAAGVASGDLSGTYPAPTVAKVNGVTYPASPSLSTVPLVTGAGVVTYRATSQLPGTATNDNASAGNIGEFISTTVLLGSAVALTTGTAANIGSVSLTAGDWDVFGTAWFAPAGTTTLTALAGWISSISATAPTPPNGGGLATFNLAFPTGAAQGFSVGRQRLSLAGTTTIYLSAQAAFGVSTMSAYGFIGARRAR